jgi:hypothetical protein
MKLVDAKPKELKGKSGVYKLSLGGHLYIGSSKDLYQRLQEHRRDLRNNAHPVKELQELVNNSTLDNVELEILEFCEPEKRLIQESYWIKTLNADLNSQDPLTHELSEASKQKLSKSIKKGLEEGKYKQWADKCPVEVYDYFGDYITEYASKEDAMKKLNWDKDTIQKLASGYNKGISRNGIRLRYKSSTVAPKKFSVNPQYLGKYYNFYYIDDSGSEQVAFHDVKDLYKFMADQLVNKKTSITIYPKLKNAVNLGNSSTEDNLNPSTPEME